MSAHMDNPVKKTVKEGQRQARQASRSPVVGVLTRLGYAARGIIYGLVGLLAVQVAVGGSSGRFTDQKGAIATIGSQPLGNFLLVLIAIGLAGYALWGFIRAFLDPLGKGSDTTGLLSRAGYFISGLSYGALLLPTINAIAHKNIIPLTGGSGSGGTQQAAASIMSKPWGPWVIGAIGVGIIVAAVLQIKMGVEANFDLRFDTYAMNAEQRRWAIRAGRFGYIARGIVFAIIGLYLFQAALYHNPSRAVSLDGALRVLSQQPYGVWLLAAVALGLIAFGVYSILGAMWFRLKKA